MKRTNRDTEAALRNAAQLSQDASNQFQVQLHHFDFGLGVNQVQIGKLDSSIAQASRLAGATEKANANLVAADRPWVGGGIRVTDFSAGNSPKAICNFVNSGRSPALIESATCTIFVDKGTSAPADIHEPGTGILLPGQETVTRIHLFVGGSMPFMDGDKITSYFIDALNAETIHIKLVGSTTYKDIRTGQRHHTRFCERYLPPIKGEPAGFYECGGDGEAD